VLYLRTRPGSEVDQLGEAGRGVTFEVDYFAADFTSAWSVLMQGRLETLEPHAVAVQRLRLPVMPWTSGLLRDLRFVPSSFSGRAITHISR